MLDHLYPTTSDHKEGSAWGVLPHYYRMWWELPQRHLAYHLGQDCERQLGKERNAHLL